ncbi:MAG TPA: hypothetical protein DEH25_17365 [Chloroflexi bacterium]|nr:hypothetical protein [Chloroflexota bacterium]HBY08943.1 hypothetical protein [Chloroflexota bacterium]
MLIPLGPGGNREYRPAVFNLAEDAPTHEPLCTAPANAILLFDGVFLLRPELIEQWDFSIFIEVDFSVAVPRAVLRDVTRNQRQWDTNTRRAQYERRYVPGQQMYLHAVHPRKRADVVVDNNDFRDPKIIRK